MYVAYRKKQKMSAEKQTGNPLEQFVLLAKTAKSAAAAQLVNQALESPGVYVFGELLDMANIQELSTGTYAPQFNLLNLFAYGTYSDYKANKDKASLPDLNPLQDKKLKHLTIVTLATKMKCIPYDRLLKELDIKNVRELEDLIIEVIYADTVRGKLDQKNQQLEVDYAIGRDIRPEAVSEIVHVLSEWCSGCEALLQGIETQIVKANTNKDNQDKLEQKIEQEVANIKKTLKSAQQQDGDEHMMADSQISMLEKPSKKQSRTKGLRGSAKLFSKS